VKAVAFQTTNSTRWWAIIATVLAVRSAWRETKREKKREKRRIR
jgi:hypothetical protein